MFSAHSMEFNWTRVFYKDYTTMFTWIVTATLVLNLEQLQYFGLYNCRRFVIYSGVVILIAAVLAYMVRRSKKGGKPANN